MEALIRVIHQSAWALHHSLFFIYQTAITAFVVSPRVYPSPYNILLLKFPLQRLASITLNFALKRSSLVSFSPTLTSSILHCAPTCEKKIDLPTKHYKEIPELGRNSNSFRLQGGDEEARISSRGPRMSQKGCSANVEREEKGIQSEESMNVDVERNREKKSSGPKEKGRN